MGRFLILLTASAIAGAALLIGSEGNLKAFAALIPAGYLVGLLAFDA